MRSRPVSQLRSPLKGSKTSMTMKNVCDLAVMGAGPAGIVGATTAASLRATVVLSDRFGDLGGAGANTGTVRDDRGLRRNCLR
jgi:NADPH-dependent 2,4-dienoyl-CoA reductase/sulfur reductase-like enzyme